MRGDDDADRAVHARKFLDCRYVVHVTHACAAQFRGKDHPHQPQLAEFFNCRKRKIAGFIPLANMGRNLPFGELANTFFKLQLFFVELEIQALLLAKE